VLRPRRGVPVGDRARWSAGRSRGGIRGQGRRGAGRRPGPERVRSDDHDHRTRNDAGRGRRGRIRPYGAITTLVTVVAITLQGDGPGSLRRRSESPTGALGVRTLPKYSWQNISDWDVSLAHEDESEALLGAIETSSGDLLAVGHADPAPLDEDAAVWTSRDGAHWRRVDVDALAEPGVQRLVDVVEFRGRLIAVGYTGFEDLDAAVWTTSVGSTGWHREWSVQESGTQAMKKILVVDGGLLVLGWSGDGAEIDAAVWRSADGQSWERIHDPHFEGVGIQQMWTGTVIGRDVIALGAIPDRDGSKDAGVWRLRDDRWTMLETGLHGAGDQQIRDVAVAPDGTVVAVGIAGQDQGEDAAIWASEVGSIRVWRRIPGPFQRSRQQELLAVVATAPGFVAMGWTDRPRSGQDGLAWLSSDGRRWSTPNPSSLDYIQLGGSKPTQQIRGLVSLDEGNDAPELVALGTSGEAPNENAEIWVGRPVGGGS
jgi:hypothetical protein